MFYARSPASRDTDTDHQRTTDANKPNQTYSNKTRYFITLCRTSVQGWGERCEYWGVLGEGPPSPEMDARGSRGGGSTSPEMEGSGAARGGSGARPSPPPPKRN